MLERWIRFNGVGALGVAVQLGVLWLLVRRGGLHYLWATALAVEAAVLHNFVLHERWTWADRRARTARLLLARAARYHLSNGVISLMGNLLLVRLLAGGAGLDPLAANIASIGACSVLNFAASERLVFCRAAAMMFTLLLLPLAAAAGDARVSAATELQPRTVQAWTTYEGRVDARFDAASASVSPFFALDAFGAPAWRETAARGGLAMSRIERSRPGDPALDVPGGKIHHWAGAIFIPNTSLDTVLRRLSELAGHESKYYQDVIGSRLLSRDGDRYRIFLKLQRTKVVTVTYNTEHTVEYRRFGGARAGARSVSTRIAELEDAGTPQEREKPEGTDSGYLWRLNAYWRYEAADGGVLVECESVSLSRAVPFVLRPFISGVVEGLARESLERTLGGLRTYLTGRSAGAPAP